MEYAELYQRLSGNCSLIHLITANSAWLEGHFRLASGRCSPIYLDKNRILVDARGLAVITSALTKLIDQSVSVHEIDGFIGSEHWGAVLAQAVATRFRETKGKSFLFFAAKKDGDQFFVRPSHIDLISGKRLLVLEDIITTGGSVMKVARLLRQYGCDVAGAVAMINRRGQTSQEFGSLPFARWLLTANLPDYDPPCTQCLAGVPHDQVYGHGSDSVKSLAS